MLIPSLFVHVHVLTFALRLISVQTTFYKIHIYKIPKNIIVILHIGFRRHSKKAIYS